MASQQVWLIYMVFLCATLSVVLGNSYEDESALLTMLQANYTADAKPATPTYITILYSFKQLQKLDITEQTMTSSGWISVYWTDPRLVWNASDYSNISVLDVNWPWRPKFLISNSAEEYIFGGVTIDNLFMRLYSDGRVVWIQPQRLTTTCDVSIERFPYDSQACYIEFVFFGLNSVDVVANVTREVYLGSYLPSAEWLLKDGYVDSSKYVQTCCPVTNYQVLQVHAKFERLRPFYVINLIIPSVALSFCMVLVFVLPTESGERLGYSLTIFLSFTVVLTITSDLMPTTSKEIPIIALSFCMVLVFLLPTESGERLGYSLTIFLSFNVVLTITSDLMPSTSKEIPNIGFYILLLFLLCAVSNFNVVINVKMYHLQNDPPQWLQKLARKLGPITFLKCKHKDKIRPVNVGNNADGRLTCTDIEIKSDIKNLDMNLQSDKTRIGFDEESRVSSNDDESVTWQQVADISDRLCLYFYSVAVVFSCIFCSAALEGGFQ